MLKIVEWGVVNWNEWAPTTGVGAKQKSPWGPNIWIPHQVRNDNWWGKPHPTNFKRLPYPPSRSESRTGRGKGQGIRGIPNIEQGMTNIEGKNIRATTWGCPYLKFNIGKDVG